MMFRAEQTPDSKALKSKGNDYNHVDRFLDFLRKRLPSITRYVVADA